MTFLANITANFVEVLILMFITLWFSDFMVFCGKWLWSQLILSARIKFGISLEAVNMKSSHQMCSWYVLHFFISKISPTLDISSICCCFEHLMSNQSHTSYSLFFPLWSNSFQVPRKYGKFHKYVQKSKY